MSDEGLSASRRLPESQQSRLELGLRLSRGFGGGEQSGLLMRTATTERDTLPMRMKSSLRL
jgi:hypothetical protein